MPADGGWDDLRSEVATGCRILARRGLVAGVLGHISARTGADGEYLIRCRGPQERGLGHTRPVDVRRVRHAGSFAEDSAGWSVPKEAPIHSVVLRSRPEAGAVVHAHPPYALLYGLAELVGRPVFGAYNIPAMRLALDGIPVYDRPVLISRDELAREMLAAMADRSVCILRGHGIVTVGPTVRAAVVAAVNLNDVCTVAVELRKMGADPPPLTEADLAELPNLGSAFDDDLAWQALVAELQENPDKEEGR